MSADAAPSVQRMVAGATIAAAACAAVVTTLVVAGSPSTSASPTSQLLGVVSCALFLAAGILRISAWRVLGDTRSLMMGAALVVLGGLALPLTSLAGVIMGDSETSLLRAVTALATTLVALTLVMRALNAPAQDPRLQPLRVVVPAAATAALVFLVLVALYAWAPALLSSPVIPPPMVRGALLAIAWFAVGLEATLRSPQLPWAGKVAPLLGCMAVAELLRVISVVHPGAWEVTGATLVATIAAVTTHRALRDLDVAARGAADLRRAASGPASPAVSPAVGPTVNETTGRRDDAREDLRAALDALDAYGAHLDVTTRERLRSAALGEVSHLEQLIIRGERERTCDFDLDPVLRTVVETRRALGADVDLAACDLRANGRPGDVARVLQHLLVNADQHGAGPVAVRAEAVGDTIEVSVTDHGPGMSLSQVAVLFQRGARGPGSTGRGLGLHVGHTLMRQQGGDLELRSHGDGCTFVLSLWRPGGPTPVSLPVQRRSRRPGPRPAGATIPRD